MSHVTRRAMDPVQVVFAEGDEDVAIKISDKVQHDVCIYVYTYVYMYICICVFINLCIYVYSIYTEPLQVVCAEGDGI